MKKIILLLTSLFTIAFTLHAQKCVVLDFQVGDDVTSEEVESVTFEFRSHFNPSCYKIEDFFRVKRILMDLHYDPATMKKEQIRKFGRDMVAAVVVYGTLNKYMDEYSLDVNVLDISTGTTIINQYNNFQKSEYRTHTREVAVAIASKLCNMTTTTPSPNTPPAQKPTQTIAGAPTIPQGYTDLGLPSGTLWKNYNSTGYYTFNEAVNQFGKRLPTKKQWEELRAECQWSWTGNGYKITGPNGNTINLPAAGSRDNISSKNEYWTSESCSNNNEIAWSFYFGSGDLGIHDSWFKTRGFSVRLVYEK